MNNMVGQLKWYAEGSDDPDVEEDVCVEVTTVMSDGTVELMYPDAKGKAYIRFSLRDLMEQICLVAGQEP